jgi:PKD repeat protein
MSTTIKYKIALAVATMLAVVLMIVLPARAAPPANDDFYAATNITSLPFSEGINTSEATSTPDDPYPTCNYPPNHTREATVWYQFIPPETQFVTAIAASNDYNNVLAVYTGAPGSFQQIACDILGHPVTLQAESGNTYYFMVAAMEPSPYPDPSGGGYGGWLNFSLSAAPPPVAYFDVWSDPYYELRVFNFSNQSYDPACSWCGFAATSWDFGDGATSSDWNPTHQYTADGSYIVNLTVITFAGQSATYQRQLNVVTPPPFASFDPWPSDPSIYETVYFNNWSSDPACYWCGMTAQWDFGDGTTSTEWNPSHQYAADGDYTVNLTVTTPDGRLGSTSRVVTVRTIDVAIYRFSVPHSAKAGQTRSVSVEINNTTYPVQVEVHLYKSVVGGWQWIGTLQQYVPVRPSNRTTRFQFSYTFTQEDALLGEINFRAEAFIVNGRDAIPTNNEAISLPTKVSP